MASPPKDLLLVRLGLVTFTPKPTCWRVWVMRFGDIEVSPVSAYESEKNLRLLVGAATVLDYRAKVTADGEVVVPPSGQSSVPRTSSRSGRGAAATLGPPGRPWSSSLRGKRAGTG